MGEAKDRGTKAERRRVAIMKGRVKNETEGRGFRMRRQPYLPGALKRLFAAWRG